eukprot:SAG31_NODE_45715_length_257_cov_1.316456_1_plen_20_part_10
MVLNLVDRSIDFRDVLPVST